VRIPGAKFFSRGKTTVPPARNHRITRSAPLSAYGTAHAPLRRKIRSLRGGSMEIETASSSSAPGQSCSANEDSWLHYQADTILVEEFYSGRRGKALLLPEQRLMLAILEDALESFQQHCAAKHGKRKQLFKSVERWFFAPGSDWVFDFESICSVLGFEPDYVRKGLAQWKERNYQNVLRSAL